MEVVTPASRRRFRAVERSKKIAGETPAPRNPRTL